MSRHCGNPAWGNPHFIRVPARKSEFEQLAKTLGLSPHQYVRSRTLKHWVVENKDRKYVPVELLAAWDLTVKTDV